LTGACQTAHATVAEIDVGAFAHNIRFIRSRLASACQLMAVMKADAYGHGAVPLAAVAVQQGAAWLGVAQCQEGVILRQAGITAPILVLGHLWPEDIEALLAYHLCPAVGSQEDMLQLQLAAARRGLVYPIHVNVDTGMGRLGVLTDRVPAFLQKLPTCANLRVEGLMTHLATVDAVDTYTVQEQLRRFRWVVQRFAAHGIRPQVVHAANSAALFRYPQSHYTLVRPGIALYGSHPFEAPDAASLRPVLTWKTRLSRVQEVPAGYGISYGHTFVTRRLSIIGTLPVGYADGLCRGLSNVGDVIVHGQRVRLAGSVCMDMCTVDLTDVPRACVGDEVVLIGAQGNVRITADEMAQRCSRIPYEIFCAIGPRVLRRYV
jgi:alanine racemase